MLKRIISGIVAFIIFLPIVIFSESGTTQGWVFPIAIAIGCAIGLCEMFNCIGVLKMWHLSIPLILIGGSMPVLARAFDGGRDIEFNSLLLMMAIVSMTYILAVSLFSKGKLPIERAALAFVTLFYIAGGFTSIVLLRDFDNYGKYIFMLIFVGAWGTDIFAYFVGRFFGRHKLIPEISPKKTVEGSIGGIVFCALLYMLYGFVLAKFNSGFSNTYWLLAIVGVIISVVAQIGDLTMSQIKRQFGIKDYGKIMPGHGGILDRCDSVLTVAFVLIVACAVIREFGGSLITI